MITATETRKPRGRPVSKTDEERKERRTIRFDDILWEWCKRKGGAEYVRKLVVQDMEKAGH